VKIAFPTQDDKGLESLVYGHFGSAPTFIIVDSALGTVEPLVNRDQHHAHGQCQPMAALGGRPIEAVVVGGIGAGALSRLNATGIKVYRAVEGTVSENLSLIQAGSLPLITLNMTCAGHSADGGCAH
jgi:predicted Fe-Mo cluster-binding NifX family protein